MACEIKSRAFDKGDGTQIVVTTRELPASKALELHIDLVGKLGNSLFPFIDGRYNFGDILQLMRTGQSESVMETLRKVISNATIDGKELKNNIVFDMLFEKEQMLVFHVFAFVLETNFLDFFKQGQELNAQRLSEAEAISAMEEQKKIQALTSPETSPT